MDKGPVRVFWYCEKWQAGGIQAVQVNLMKHMDPARVSFDIAVSEDDTQLFDGQLAACGARKIVSLKRRYTGPGMRTLANIFAVGRLIRTGGYDAVHFNVCHGVELIYTFWAWLFRVPMRIVHCRNNDIGAGGRMRGVKIMAHRICRRVFGGFSNVRLANSELAARWLYTKQMLDSGSVRILKNGIEASRYAFDNVQRARVRKELGIENRLVIGHVGHFNYQKNHEFLLRIFREIAERNDGARLLLVGVGEREDEMRALARELGIYDKVIFYGVTNDVPELMWAMDAFVFPSRFEGFGNVLVEAQAAGLKCFASDKVIPRAVHVTDNIEWISLDEPACKWAERILDAAGQEYERRGHTDEVVRAGYDIACMADRLGKLYCGELRADEI